MAAARSQRQQVAEYLDWLFSDRKRIVAIALGNGGHYNEHRKCRV